MLYPITLVTHIMYKCQPHAFAPYLRCLFLPLIPLLPMPRVQTPGALDFACAQMECNLHECVYTLIALLFIREPWHGACTRLPQRGHGFDPQARDKKSHYIISGFNMCGEIVIRKMFFCIIGEYNWTSDQELKNAIK